MKINIRDVKLSDLCIINLSNTKDPIIITSQSSHTAYPRDTPVFDSLNRSKLKKIFQNKLLKRFSNVYCKRNNKGSWTLPYHADLEYIWLRGGDLNGFWDNLKFPE